MLARLLLRARRGAQQQHRHHQHRRCVRGRSNLPCSVEGGFAVPMPQRLHRLRRADLSPWSWVPPPAASPRFVSSAASGGGASARSSRNPGEAGDAADAYDPSAWRRLLKVFFLRSHPDTLHGLPAAAQRVNAESYKTLNDFLDTAAGFVEAGRPANSHGGRTGETSKRKFHKGPGRSVPSAISAAQALYDMKFYIKPPAGGGGSWGSDAAADNNDTATAPAPRLVRVKLAVPTQHRTVPPRGSAGAATDVWLGLVRRCLRELAGTVSTTGTPLPEWVAQSSSARSSSSAAAQPRRRFSPMSRREVHAALHKALSQPGGFGGGKAAAAAAAVAAEKAAVHEFNLGGFPPEVQRFIARHVVFDTGVAVAAARRADVGGGSVQAVSRLAVALLRHAEELELDGPSPSPARPGRGEGGGGGGRGGGTATAANRGKAGRKGKEGRGKYGGGIDRAAGPTVIIAPRAGHGGCGGGGGEEDGGPRRRRGQRTVMRATRRALGASGVSLDRRSAEVVVAEDFDEDAFVAAFVRAKERLGLFDDGDDDAPLY